jgi:phage terminase Nu1 subunit (DNA packaging protein)
MIVSAAALAEYYEVDRRTVTNWVNSDPPCPSWKEGNERKFDTAKVADWRERNAARRAADDARRESPADYEDAKARKMAADAELAELQLAKERGELIAVEDALAERVRVYGHLRAKLLNMPAKYAASTVGCRTIAESKIRWEDAVAEAMAVLSDSDDEYDEGAAERAA